MKFVQRENFEPKIKPMIENLHDELDQLEKKQGKGAELCSNIRQESEGEKGSKLSSEYLNFLAKFRTLRKYLMNTLIFVRQKYL